MFDVIVAGAGAAGLSAALWCDELGLKTIVLDSGAEIGGQLLWVYNRIENHLGAAPAENGRALCDQFAAQISARNFLVKTDAEIVRADLKTKEITLRSGDILQARAIILATGVRRRELNVPGEKRLRGRGILESGKRDAARVAGKTVCIVGGGDAACENALILGETAAKVYLVHRRREFSARDEFTSPLKNHPRVELLLETEVTQILGADAVAGVELRNAAGELFQLSIDAFLTRIGVAPNTELVSGQIEIKSNGYLKVDFACRTSLPLVYAAGDVANPLAPTVSTAVGMGATAAKALFAALESPKN